jgi:short-subunit dehydrogenase
MKIAITGHTSGIGKALHDKFIMDGHEVLGFSRTNEFDIRLLETRKKILDLSKDADVFINNAYAPWGQTHLLNELILNWSRPHNLVINIGSIASVDSASNSVYSIPKIYIHDKTEQHRMCYRKPGILNIIVGFVDTPMVQDFCVNKRCPKQLAEIIDRLIQLKTQPYHRI